MPGVLSLCEKRTRAFGRSNCAGLILTRQRDDDDFLKYQEDETSGRLLLATVSLPFSKPLRSIDATGGNERIKGASDNHSW